MQKVAEARSHQDEFELRKQAIMVGLSPYMSLEDCLDAIRLWEKQFSRAPKFALQQFIKQVVTADSRTWDMRNDIFINVIKVMALQTEEIERQFKEIFHGEMDYVGVAVDPKKREQQQVFEQLYETYIRQLEAMDYQLAGKLRKFLRERMLQVRNFAMERQRLNAWLLGIADKLEVELSLEEMRQIIHEAYIGSCEYLGPVKADALLAEAVKKVEPLSKAGDFSVRELL